MFELNTNLVICCSLNLFKFPWNQRYAIFGQSGFDEKQQTISITLELLSLNNTSVRIYLI